MPDLFPPTRIRGVLFDLDGTLLNTLDDIAAAANAALAQVGAPPHAVADYKRFIGEGVLRLFEQSLPAGRADEATVARCAHAFEETYEREWNRLSRPYPGITELLDELTTREIKLAVLSNKPHHFTAACVEHFFCHWPFLAVLGPQPGVPRKPNPAGAQQILAKLELAPEETLYVGDTGIDMQTARAAGMFAIGVTWGFRPTDELVTAGAQRLIDRPLDLLNLLAT